MGKTQIILKTDFASSILCPGCGMVMMKDEISYIEDSYYVYKCDNRRCRLVDRLFEAEKPKVILKLKKEGQNG